MQYEHVHVENSTLHNAGYGLFVDDDHSFKVGDIICEYGGELVDFDLAGTDDYHSDYLFKVSKDWVIDAEDQNSGYGRYMNDPIVSSKVNAKIMARKKRLIAEVVATKPIKSNKEIFVSYGIDYWMDLDHYDNLTPKHQKYLYNNSGERFQKWVEENYDV